MKRKYPPIFYWNYTFNYNGFIIPMVGIVINKAVRNDSNIQNLIDHEMIHWQQFKKYRTLLYLLLYGLDILYHGYDKSLFEYEARFNESAFSKWHYTYAVRTGLAKTPKNPNFRKWKRFNNPIRNE